MISNEYGLAASESDLKALNKALELVQSAQMEIYKLFKMWKKCNTITCKEWISEGVVV